VNGDLIVGVLLVTIVVTAVVMVIVFVPRLQRSSVRLRSVSSGLAGTADEIWHPERVRGMQEWEAEVAAPAPAPSPGEDDLDQGRIRLNL